MTSSTVRTFGCECLIPILKRLYHTANFNTIGDIPMLLDPLVHGGVHVYRTNDINWFLHAHIIRCMHMYLSCSILSNSVSRTWVWLECWVTYYSNSFHFLPSVICPQYCFVLCFLWDSDVSTPCTLTTFCYMYFSNTFNRIAQFQFCKKETQIVILQQPRATC